MCGIAYIHDLNGHPVNNDLMQQFDQQRHRGVDGFGLFDGQFRNMVKTVTEDKILNWLCKYDSDLLLFHHRYPTSTLNIKRAAHPFSTRKHFGDTQYIMVHNGVIRNADDLYDEHIAQGIAYDTLLTDGSFNDSESLLWDFALTMEGYQESLTAEGDMAIVVLKLVDDELDSLYFGRNTWRPLKWFQDKDRFELSSEGRGADVQTNVLYRYHYPTKEVTSQPMMFHSGVRPVAKTTTPVQYTAGTTFGDLGDDGLDDHFGDYPDSYAGPDRYGDWPSRGAKFLRSINPFKREEPVFVAEAAVASHALEYMLAVNGHFESAYWAVEEDYDVIMQQLDERPDDRDLQYEARLTELTMQTIQYDPEYKDHTSYSSIIGAIKCKTPA